MKKLSLLSALVFALVFTLASCKNDKASESANPAPAATTTPQAAATPATQANTVPAYTGPSTTMTFGEPTHDFGKIMDGDKVEHVFVFENTGSEPLVISNAKGSCGCTVPDWPKDPIKPGATGEIKVVYNSKGKGKVGGKNENKTVTITANTTPPETRIFVKGIVDKEETAG
jgi:hypothetical protein